MIQRKDKEYIELAQYVARFSKCKRAQYATVWIGKHGHLIGASWNGKPKGVNCDDVCFREESYYRDRGLEVPTIKPSCCIHAEDNGVAWTNHVDRQGGTVYVNGVPCDMCYLRLLNSGVARIVYLVESDCQHICNLIDQEFKTRYENGTEVVPFTFKEWEEIHLTPEVKEKGNQLELPFTVIP